MITDYVGQEVKVGDVMVYSAGRGAMQWGLVTATEEITSEHNPNWVRCKVKVARVTRNRKWEYNNGNSRTIDYGNWKVTRTWHENSSCGIVLRPEQIVNKQEIDVTMRFASEILAGAKEVGVRTA